jgi:hypothetical protein
MSVVSRAFYGVGTIAMVLIAYKVSPVVWHEVGPLEAFVSVFSILRMALDMVDRAVTGRAAA